MKLCLFAVLLGVAMIGRGAVLAPGFTEVTFPVPGVSGITDIAWAPDTTTRLFMAQKDGTVRILQRGQLVPAPFAVLSPIYVESECGLIGMCFDPSFLQNRFVYFFVTVSASEQQIIRYEDANDVGVNKTMIVGGLPTMGSVHDGGGLAIGLDGLIYFSIGDQGPGVGVNADLTTLAAKVGRRTRSGAVPTLNPFNDGSGPNNDSIWARGFRNPFKIAVQPSTGILWVNVAGNAYEQVFAIQKGDHAGWSNYENNQPANGFIRPRIKYRTNGRDVRDIAAGGAYRHEGIVEFTTPGAHGFRKGERVTIADVFNDPSFDGTFYVVSTPSATRFTTAQAGPHAVSGFGTATTTALGGAITGGCFYNATDFPEQYWQSYFFCDFNSDRVNVAAIDTTNEVTAVDFFINGIDGAVDVATAPNGFLFYAGFNEEVIYRIAYNHTQQEIVMSPSYLNMSEGGVAVVNVRLPMQPAADLAVTVSGPVGSPGITTTNVVLTFSPTNFGIQPLYIQAPDDADRFHSQAVFTLSAPGLADRKLHVNAYDPDHGALAFTGLVRSNQATRLQIASEPRTRVALDATTNFALWHPFATNLMTNNAQTILDLSPTAPRRAYRARVVP